MTRLCVERAVAVSKMVQGFTNLAIDDCRLFHFLAVQLVIVASTHPVAQKMALSRTQLIASNLLLFLLAFVQLPLLVNFVCMLAAGLLSTYAVFGAAAFALILWGTNSESSEPDVSLTPSMFARLFLLYPAYRATLVITSVSLTLLYADRVFPGFLFAASNLDSTPFSYMAFVIERLTTDLLPGINGFRLSAIELSESYVGQVFDFVIFIGAISYVADLVRAWVVSIWRIFSHGGDVDSGTVKAIEDNIFRSGRSPRPPAEDEHEEAGPWDWMRVDLPKLSMAFLLLISMALISVWFFGLVPTLLVVGTVIAAAVALSLLYHLASILADWVSTGLGTDDAP